MLRLLHHSLGSAIFVVLLLAACATTQLNSTWRDPSYQNHPHKMMVIGVVESPIKRRIFEDEFVGQLEARGTDAVASYKVLPDKEQNDKAAIAQKMKEQGADAVLITRLVNKRSVKVYVPGTTYLPPPHYGTWPNYYGYGYQVISTPGYMTKSEYAVIETNLYDANSEKLIWAAISETGMSGSDREFAKSYVDAILNSLSRQGLVGK